MVVAVDYDSCTDIYISPQRTSAANDLQDIRSVFTLNLSFWPSSSAGRNLGPDLIVPRSSAFSIYQLARPRAVSTLFSAYRRDVGRFSCANVASFTRDFGGVGGGLGIWAVLVSRACTSSRIRHLGACACPGSIG